MYIYYKVLRSEWIDMFDAVFFLTISSLVFGCFGLVIKYCLRSNCDHINLCFGLITIHRHVEVEAEEEMKEIELQGVTKTEKVDDDTRV
jgi:hypothetical protein